MRLLPLLICLLPASMPAQNTPDSTLPMHKAPTPVKLPVSKIAPNTPLSARERALQMLNRFTYGPRPGEVDRVLAQGPDQWFQQQLYPAAIPDGAVERRLGAYPILSLTPPQILAVYPDRGMLSQVTAGKRPIPADPLEAKVYEVELFKYRAEQVSKNQPKPPEPSDADKAAAKAKDQATAARIAGELFALPKKDRMATLNAMPIEDRIAFTGNLSGDQKNTLLADLTPREREAFSAMAAGQGATYQMVDELAQAKILRAILSERQLNEVMTDFWFNHFNIFMDKDSDRWYTTPYERDVIRPRALGKFRDLLLATATSPAMMVYLDNWLSVGPNSIANGVNPQKPGSKPGKLGLNENYGREVMELHTVGVNGGYTQADVTHLAAILTGWGVDEPGKGGPFLFNPNRHEPGTKVWLGYQIDDDGHVLAQSPGTKPVPPLVPDVIARTAPGMRQGVMALSILAASPQTAHFVSYLLAQRFLADEPPPALVDRMAQRYLASDGDTRAVLRTLVASPEFNQHRFFRNKAKTPFEFIASAFRATATDPVNPGSLEAKLGEFGEPPYRALPPTGYYITEDKWMNTQALLGRLNFADQLAHSHFANVRFDASRLLALGLMTDRGEARPGPVSAAAGAGSGMGSEVALRVLEGTLIGGEISPGTADFIHAQLAAQPASANPTDTLNLLSSLLLGSPEFQLR